VTCSFVIEKLKPPQKVLARASFAYRAKKATRGNFNFDTKTLAVKSRFTHNVNKVFLFLSVIQILERST